MGSTSRQASHLRKTLSFSYAWTKYTLTPLWSKQLALILSHWHRVQMNIDRAHSVILTEKVCTIREALPYKKDGGLLVREERSTARAFAVPFTVLSRKKYGRSLFCFRIKNFKPRPQNRILISTRSSFQNFQQGSPSLPLPRPSPNLPRPRCTICQALIKCCLITVCNEWLYIKWLSGNKNN